MPQTESLDSEVGPVLARFSDGTEFRRALGRPAAGDLHTTPDGEVWRAVHQAVVDGRIVRTPSAIAWRIYPQARPGRMRFTSPRSSYDPDEWTRAVAAKRAVPGYVPFQFSPSAADVGRIFEGPAAFFPLSRGPRARIETTENPAPRGSLGYAGPVIEVRGEGRLSGVLAFGLPGRQARDVVRSTIRVFRWNPVAASFEAVEPGAVNDRYAWARIAAPGIYTLIGMPADPFKQALVRVTSALAPTLAGMSAAARADLLRAIERALTRREWFRSFGPLTMQSMCLGGWLPEPDFGFGFGGFPADPEVILGWEPGEDLCPPMPPHGWPEWVPIPSLPMPHWTKPWIDEGWASLGPKNIPGHSTEVQVDPVQPERIYTTTATGGVWVLDDVNKYPFGSRWRPLTDFEENLNAECMAIAPSDNRVLYYANVAGQVFRSADRGGNWTRMPDDLMSQANRLLVHPADANRIYLATEAGFFRSVTGGGGWEQLYVGAVADAAMDHQASDTIYLGVRKVGLVKTTNAGAEWDTVFAWSNADAPQGTEIRIALGRQRTPATRTVVVRFDQETLVNHNGGVAIAGPDGWSSKGKWGGDGQGWWDFCVAISPHDENILLTGAQDLYRSTDGGNTPWTVVGGYPKPEVHSDQWDIRFDPANQGVVYLANDGGVYRSADSGATWTYLNIDLVSGQIYATGTSADRAITGMYHEGIVASESIGTGLWECIEGGAWEFSQVHGDPKRPYYFYLFPGKLRRRRWPNAATGPSFDLNWGDFETTALGVDARASSEIILAGATNPSALKRTTQGDSATPVWTDEPIALGNGEVITAIAFAPSQPATAYALTNLGRIFRKADVASAGAWVLAATWATADGPRGLAVHAFDEQRLYVLGRRTLVAVDLIGAAWSTITGTAPTALPAFSDYQALVVHPNVAGVLFVALRTGVFVSTTDGTTWANYDNANWKGFALPNGLVSDMHWHQGALYVALEGRGLWRRVPVL